jgi:outer membrane protein TolC
MISDSYQYYRNPNVFSGHAIIVTQAFPLWGKRDLRREAALADLDAMRGREQAARDALDERIKVAFAQYYVASRALAVNREVIAVTRGMRAAAEARYAAGQGDQAAVILALGEETAAEVEAPLEAARGGAEVLNALIARPASAPLPSLRLRRARRESFNRLPGERPRRQPALAASVRRWMRTNPHRLARKPGIPI